MTSALFLKPVKNLTTTISPVDWIQSAAFPYKSLFNKLATISTDIPINVFLDNNIPLYAVMKLNNVSC